ncbi:hypothetical protein FBEOM_2123 [Fusarium beomiforme]|uniref:Uncharacterized protein n=1 Tax=Fusarium beomiforme TaxID=44412 RepID=A0A9P5E3U1_9HYPO|nr:hypothetical protein FBEOM_2123 [Fusarium beomiforme]
METKKDSPYASSTDLSSDSDSNNVPQTDNYRTGHHAQKPLEGSGVHENGPNTAPEDLEDILLDDDDDSEFEVREDGYKVLDGPLTRGAMHRDRSMNELPPEDPAELKFDDREMVEVLHGELYYEGEEEHRLRYNFAILLSPIHRDPFCRTPKLTYESTSNLLQNVPGTQAQQETLAATAQIAKNNLVRSYSNLAGGLAYTARLAQDAMALTTQAGSHIAEEASLSGNGFAIQVQEWWPNVPPIINRGVLGSLTELVLEGVQSLPPTDSIIRPQGRRMPSGFH